MVLIFLIVVSCNKKDSDSTTDRGESYPRHCGEYSVNENRSLISEYENSMTILRKNQDLYEVTIDMKFEYGTSYDGIFSDQAADPIYAEKIHQHYHQFVSKCLVEMKDFFFDSRGRKLEINLQKSRPLAIKDKRIKIKIMGEGHRSTSTHYESVIDCPTVGHEVFHTLGLVDEYEETAQTAPANKDTDVSPKYAYDCRAVTKGSWMSDPGGVSFIPPNDVSMELLVCQCDNKECEIDDIVKKIEDYLSDVPDPTKISQCPLGYTSEKFNSVYVQFDPDQKPNMEKQVTEFGTFGGITEDIFRIFKGFYQQTTPIRKDQMDIILFPGCSDMNKLYKSCATNAYVTSKANGGAGCYPVPDECKNGSWAKFPYLED